MAPCLGGDFMFISNQSQRLAFVALLGFSLAFSTIAATQQHISCKVSNSLDYFSLDSSKQIFASANFTFYQQFDGLTVVVLNNHTLRFNRLTNLNLLANSATDPNKPPQSLQFFSGHCQRSPISVN